MARYRVTWVIDLEDVDLNTRTQAAELALRIMRDHNSTATVFEVAEDSGDNPMRVDLGEGA